MNLLLVARPKSFTPLGRGEFVVQGVQGEAWVFQRLDDGGAAIGVEHEQQINVVFPVAISGADGEDRKLIDRAFTRPPGQWPDDDMLIGSLRHKIRGDGIGVRAHHAHSARGHGVHVKR
jgi:hypothetical protein